MPLPLDEPTAAMPEALFRLRQLTRELEERVPSVKGALPDLEAAKGERHTVLTLGAVKSGKSTLVNALIGSDLMARGSGVKTFCAARVRAGAVMSIRIALKPEEALRETLRRDARLVDYPLAVPKRLYPVDDEARRGIGVLSANLKAIEEGSPAGASANPEISTARARLRTVLAGLSEMAELLDEEGRSLDSWCLDLGDDAPRFRRWTGSPGLAALVQDVEIMVPRTSQRLDGIDLVDCQGSDSTNPLDLAAVTTLLPKADTVLYVVGSRMGLRQADHAFLERLARADLARRVLLIHNVDAFVPLRPAELAHLEDKLLKDAPEACRDLTVISLTALDELARSQGFAERDAIEQLWERAGVKDVLESLRAGFRDLEELLAAGRENREALPVPALVESAKTVVSALLCRDEDVVGIKALAAWKDEIDAATARVCRGEREAVLQRLFRMVEEAFDQEGAIWREARTIPEPSLLVARYALPTAEELEPEELIEHAKKSLRSEWRVRSDDLVARHLRPLAKKAAAELLTAVESVHRSLETMTADLRSARAGMALPTFDAWRRALEAELADLLAEASLPTPMRATALDSDLADVLPLAYRAAVRWDRLLARMKGKDAPSVLKRREKLYERALKRGLRRLARDLAFGLSSARENLKHLYLKPLAEAFFERYEARVSQRVAEHYRNLEEASGRLLLSAPERRYLEAYLAELDGLLTAAP